MRTYVAGCLALLLAFVLADSSEAQDKKDEPKVVEVGKPEPSPIPEKLMADAKKAFDKKMIYFIWTDAKAGKAKDCAVRFAVNPDFKEEPVFTVAKFTYTAKNGMKVPYSQTGDGIAKGLNGPGGYKGATDVNIFLVKGSDVITPKGVAKEPEKLPPVSNTITVKLTFE